MQDIYDSLRPVFRDVFDNDAIELTPATTAADVEEWDSLSHIRLMVAIEQAFGIRFTTTEIASFKNVSELVGCIAVKSGRG